MDVVLAESCFESSVFVSHDRIVVDIFDSVIFGIALNELIESLYLLRGIQYKWIPRNRARRKDRAEDGLDLMCFGQFAHRDDISHDVFDRYSAVVLRYIVDAAEYDDVFGMEVDNILPETNEQFGGSLSADSTSDESI